MKVRTGPGPELGSAKLRDSAVGLSQVSRRTGAWAWATAGSESTPIISCPNPLLMPQSRPYPDRWLAPALPRSPTQTPTQSLYPALPSPCHGPWQGLVWGMNQKVKAGPGPSRVLSLGQDRDKAGAWPGSAELGRCLSLGQGRDGTGAWAGDRAGTGPGLGPSRRSGQGRGRGLV